MFEHTPALYAALHKFAYSRENQDADFTQDVIAIVLEQFNRTYDPTRSKVTTYLFCLTWSAVQLVRQRRKLKSKRMPTVFLGDSDVAAPQSSLSIDNVDRVETALRGIPPRCKQAINLIFYENCTYKSAGDIMGVSRQRVQQLTDQGLRAMRANLTEG